MIQPFLSVLEREGLDFQKEYTILDVGSRDCMQAIELSAAFPKSSIIAFECNPSTIPLCRNNIRDKKNIVLVDKAVNTYDGECKFYPIDPSKTITTWADGNPGASSLFISNGHYDVEKYVQNEVTVPCIRIDTAMKELGVDKVDLIWMDLQGAELLALKSMGEKLRGVSYIHLEVTHREMYTNQVLFEEIDRYLLNNNFKRLTQPHRHGWQEDIIYKGNLNSYTVIIS